MSHALIAALQNPALYPHPVEAFQVVETHISWVVLTGPFAYKMKKPVNFGFLDFTTLEARKHFCEEELRLNQRLTENLYLDVLPITGSESSPELNGSGPVIDYVLRMRQFPQSQLLSEVEARGELTAAHIDALAQQIADFHQRTPAVPADHPLCAPASIAAPIRQNFEQIRPLLSEPGDLLQLEALEAWVEASYSRLEPLLARRGETGSIRECHGDVHLGNATLLDDKVVLFDCIEFNEPFRLIDIALDTAFLAMDLEDRGLMSLSRRFTNAWLELSGDYAALDLLPLYKAHRALVRAKVNLFRLGQETDEERRAAILAVYRRYANLAEGYSAIPTPFLAITHGVSAVGKSHVAMRLVESFGAIRVRSDFERKRLFGEQVGDATGLKEGIYQPDVSEKTYQRLNELATQALHAGFPVVLDATYLKQAQRAAAWKVAENSGVPFLIIDCDAPQETIAGWLKQRQNDSTDPSDATLEVIAAQIASREPLSEKELAHSKRVETPQSNSVEELVNIISQRLPGL